MAHICTMYKLLQLHSVLQVHSFILRSGSYHDMLSHWKEAVTTSYSGERVNNYTSNNFVLSLKERGSMCSIAKDHCFRTVSPATVFAQDTRGHLKHKHSTWTSQTGLGTSPSSALFTGRHSNESDHDTLYRGRQ